MAEFDQQRELFRLQAFNDYQSQTRQRIEFSVKSIFLISGGMLTLSVGAVLSDKPARIPDVLIPTLQWAWGLLFYSIATALLLMLLLVISSVGVGKKWQKKIIECQSKTEVIKVPKLLNIANWVIGVSSMVSCLLGIGLVAHVALSLAGANTHT